MNINNGRCHVHSCLFLCGRNLIKSKCIEDTSVQGSSTPFLDKRCPADPKVNNQNYAQNYVFNFIYLFLSKLYHDIYCQHYSSFSIHSPLQVQSQTDLTFKLFKLTSIYFHDNSAFFDTSFYFI